MSCEHSGEYVTAAHSVTTTSMECSSLADACSSTEVGYHLYQRKFFFSLTFVL